MPLNRRVALASFAMMSLALPTALWAQVAPQDLPPPSPQPPPPPPAPVPSSASTRNSHLPTASIIEFRSSVAEVSPRGATDMFISALVRTRRFRVLERARMAEGIAVEKALNQQGVTAGQSGQTQYASATYLFEATISEASSGDKRSSFTLGVAGAAAGTGSSSDSLAIDVRVTDVESGIVVDAVTVRREIKSVETKVAGVTSALTNLFTKGRGSGVADMLRPDDQYVNARKDSVDKSLREAIEEAVNTIARRVTND